MTVGPGEELPPDVAAHAERERVLGALKTAFMDGRLDKEEFELRVGRVLAAYAEVDSLIADIPPALALAVPPQPDSEPDNMGLAVRAAGTGAGTSMLIVTALATWHTGNPLVGLILGSATGAFVTLVLAGFLTVLSVILDITQLVWG